MDNQLVMIAYGISLFILSLIFVRLFCHYAAERGLLDIPNARSSHQINTPRGGGVVFVLLWLFAVIVATVSGFVSFKYCLILLPGLIAVSLVGFFDDRKSIAPKYRLFIQMLAALVCMLSFQTFPTLHLFGIEPIYLGFFGILFGMLVIVWSINLFNFMDGIDGISAIEAIFVLGMSSVFFWLKDQSEFAFIPFLMTMSVLGFLIWNWPRAKIFMGDVGSYCLGFLIAVLSLIADVFFEIPITLWIILYGLFWFDATVTLIRRILLKKHWATAHLDHAYQRLNQAGFSHAMILRWVIVINSLLSLIALWTFYHQEWMIYSLLCTVFVLTGCYLWVERLRPLDKTEIVTEVH